MKLMRGSCRNDTRANFNVAKPIWMDIIKLIKQVSYHLGHSGPYKGEFYEKIPYWFKNISNFDIYGKLHDG
jgi:hypothetical protein